MKILCGAAAYTILPPPPLVLMMQIMYFDTNARKSCIVLLQRIYSLRGTKNKNLAKQLEYFYYKTYSAHYKNGLYITTGYK